MQDVLTVEGVMDISIKYTDKERLELGQTLSGKRMRIDKLKAKLKELQTEIKDEMKEIEGELALDIATLESGIRNIQAAKVDATLDKDKSLVTIKYQGRTIKNEKLDQEKHKALFGEMAVY